MTVDLRQKPELLWVLLFVVLGDPRRVDGQVGMGLSDLWSYGSGAIDQTLLRQVG